MQHSKTKILKIAIFGLNTLFLIFYAAPKVAYSYEFSSDFVIDLVNESRARSEIHSLIKNDYLEKAASDKLEDMIHHDYFAHISPDGVEPWFWIEKNGYDYTYAGENLAINFTDVKKQHAAWMKSPSHKKNILSRDFSEIGVAVKEIEMNGNKSTITVQMFGSRIQAKPPILKTSESVKGEYVSMVEFRELNSAFLVLFYLVVVFLLVGALIVDIARIIRLHKIKSKFHIRHIHIH